MVIVCVNIGVRPDGAAFCCECFFHSASEVHFGVMASQNRPITHESDAHTRWGASMPRRKRSQALAKCLLRYADELFQFVLLSG